MSALVRGLLLVVLVGVAVFLFTVAGDESRGSADNGAPRWQSSQQCRECHQDVWNEWMGSHHQISYLNEEVRKLSDDFRRKECQACHLPRPISETGYAARTLPRQTRPTEGVGCLTCHLGADGGILARHDRPEVGCAPVASEDVVSVGLCESCHNQHWTTDQWRASPYPAKGQDCNHCHMPEVERDGRKGRSHVFPGAHDEEMLRRAGRFTVEVVDGKIELALENVGAGHSFPTEERHRAVDMMVRFELADGSVTPWERAYRFRMPYRDEPGEDTQLPAGERVAVKVDVPEDAERAEARLWYRLAPYIGDDDPRSTLLEEREVPL